MDKVEFNIAINLSFEIRIFRDLVMICTNYELSGHFFFSFRIGLHCPLGLVIPSGQAVKSRLKWPNSGNHTVKWKIWINVLNIRTWYESWQCLAESGYCLNVVFSSHQFRSTQLCIFEQMQPNGQSHVRLIENLRPLQPV